MVKNPLANVGAAGAVGSISGSGRSPGGRHGNPLQYSCLENPMDRGAWWAAVHGVSLWAMTEASEHINHYCQVEVFKGLQDTVIPSERYV